MQCRMQECYADIMSELLVSDEAEFTNFIRMNKATFDTPWSWGTQDTKLHLVIPSQKKLVATLRRLNYITTGEFQKHSFISSAFRLPKMHRAIRD